MRAPQVASGPSACCPDCSASAVILYVIAWDLTDVRLNRLVERFNDARTVATNLLNPDLITISINGEDQVCAWSCMYTYVGDSLAGRPTAGVIRPSKNLLDIVGRMKTDARTRLAGSASDCPRPGSKVNTFVAGSMIETIAMGLMATIFSTILAVPVSFLAARNIMDRMPGGTVIYYVTRTILNIVRAIDTIVWGLIVIVWVGLGSFAGVMALTIHRLRPWASCSPRRSSISIRDRSKRLRRPAPI